MRKTTGTYESCHARPVMSLPWGISGRISVLTPVSTVTEAAAAAAAGASLVDVGDDDELIPAIRDATRDVRISGRGAGADIIRDAALAARAGAGLICPDPDAAARAVRRGILGAGGLWVTEYARPGRTDGT